MGSAGFDAGWLAARRQYDEAALDLTAVRVIQVWVASLPADAAPVVVDLGSGTGAALGRARQWLAPRRIVGYAVDKDAALLAQGAVLLAESATSASSEPHDAQVAQLAGDLLEPLTVLGGPADGTVDLVLGHALADLLPLDRLAARAAALVRPGGLVHLALAYDGQTTFGPPLNTQLATLESAILSLFHQHMDQRQASCPSYGGSTSGRRLAEALTAAGLEIVADGPSIWQVSATDGPGGVWVLRWLLRFVADAAGRMRGLPVDDLQEWLQARRGMIERGELTARVMHRDVLARRPD